MIDKKFNYIIDVRSPREFEDSHIPLAINLPIFNNDEFDNIGKLYKENPSNANIEGAKIACKNIASIIENNKQILEHKNKILIYCARGGNRSLALYQVLKSIKMQVERLEGGYKEYRKYITNYLQDDIDKKFLTLCGNTGCGKSEIIKECNSWSIDLEFISKHCGSVFGFILGKQPSMKMFQNQLVEELETKNDKLILIENESKKLGNIIIPSKLYNAYKNGFKILVITNLENRIKRILNMYENIKDIDFRNSLEKITPYIEKNIKNSILKAWEKGDKHIVTEILLIKYYDKVYKQEKTNLTIKADSIKQAINCIYEIKNDLLKKVFRI